MAKKRKKAKRKVSRSSKSGKFVPKGYAKRHKATTQTEAVDD